MNELAGEVVQYDSIGRIKTPKLAEMAEAGIDPDRFWAKVDRSGGPDACWSWMAYRTIYGYGTVRTASGKKPAHRVAYVLDVGPIQAGLQIDHLCRVRHCVNPAHLEPVTARVNNLRAPGTVSAINARKTHCDSGHPLFGPNLYRNSRGRRKCRKCMSLAGKRHRERAKLAQNAETPPVS